MSELKEKLSKVNSVIASEFGLDVTKYNEELNWWKLDNAALIYPSNTSKKWPGVFRFSCYLKEEVKPEILQQAVNDIMPRFPFFNVRLKKGVFWYYLEEMPSSVAVTPDNNYACRAFNLDAKQHIIRIMYHNRRITCEYYHSICDGRGSVKFLTALVTRYFEIQDFHIADKVNYTNYLDLPQHEEFEDAFARYADLKHIGKREGTKPCFDVHGTPLEVGQQLNYTAVFDANQFKQVAKEKGASLTEYMIASLMLAYKRKRTNNKPIAIQVPIDCRRFFPTETMRNFSSFKYVSMLETNDYDEMILDIRRQLSEIDKDYVMGNINANVQPQSVKILKVVPVSIKNIGLKVSNWLYGERLTSSCISNVGLIKVPEELQKHIEFFEFNLGRSKANNICTACCSFGDVMCWSFTSKIKENDLLTDLFKHLSDDGLDIKIYSNKEK